MIILHPYSTNRFKDKIETWKFVDSIRNKYNIVDSLINAPTSYHELIKQYWSKDDLIVIEDDKVPTIIDLEELINCPKLFCVFPYPISSYNKTTMDDWTINFPYGLGFVKIAKYIQDNITPDFSYKVYQKPYRQGTYMTLDRQIEQPIIQQLNIQPHIHNHFIKHNHKPKLIQRLYWFTHGH